MLEESKQSDFNDPELSSGVKMAEHHLLELCEQLNEHESDLSISPVVS